MSFQLKQRHVQSGVGCCRYSELWQHGTPPGRQNLILGSFEFHLSSWALESGIQHDHLLREPSLTTQEMVP